MKDFGRAVRVQINFLLGQWGFRLTFALLMALMLMNFTGNVLEFRGYDVISMFHPMKLLTLSFNRTYLNENNTMLLIQLVPLLVCLPAALSLAGEQQTGQSVLISARLGRWVYLWSRLTAVFVVTAVAFALPFLLEIGLNCIAFPLEAVEGDLMGYNIYDPWRKNMESTYQLLGLCQLSPYLYAVVCTLLFGLFIGLLAAATTALSALVQVKFRVLLLLPAFLLLQLTMYLGDDGSTAWHNYFLFFGTVSRNGVFFAILVAALAVFALAGTALAARKDCLR